MDIEGYTYITHKLIRRPWGPECRFTFARENGSHINEVIKIPGMDISNQDLIALVSARLAQIKAAEDREALYIKELDGFGPEVAEAIHWLIRKIIRGASAWGHEVSVTQDNVRAFFGNFTGTGTIEGSGNAERIKLEAGQYMESEVVDTGAVTVTLAKDVY